MKLNFALFKNDKKQGNQPDFRSPMNTPIQINEPGEYRVAGWFKEKDGKKYMSCILEKVVPGQSMGPSRDENVDMIQKVRQALGPGAREPSAANHYPPPQAPPGYRPAQQYGNPQRPPNPSPPPAEDDLPF